MLTPQKQDINAIIRCIETRIRERNIAAGEAKAKA